MNDESAVKTPVRLLGDRRFAAIVSMILRTCATVTSDTGDQAERLTRWGISAAIAGASIFYWWRVVTPEWVRRLAELYADRLLEAVEALRTAEPRPTAG